MLESQCHEHSSFATFTYEETPFNGTLVKQHLSSTMHRLRKRAGVLRRTIRFFGVGEYGEIGARPHYHAAIFGINPDDRYLLQECWNGIHGTDPYSSPGFVHLGSLNAESASYVTGYVTKKLTKPEDPRLPPGCIPEFTVMSRRPGIGAPALLALIEALNTSAGALYMARHKDVPVSFMVGKKLMPLGPYIRAKLRTFFFGDHLEPQSAKDLHNEKFAEALMPAMPISSEIFTKRKRITVEEDNLLRQILDVHVQKEETSRRVRLNQVTTKHKIHQSRRTL